MSWSSRYLIALAYVALMAAMVCTWKWVTWTYFPKGTPDILQWATGLFGGALYLVTMAVVTK